MSETAPTGYGRREYTSRAFFEREQRALGERAWHFAGLTTEIPEHNNYLTLDLGTGQSVTIQNFHGTLRAFANVCSHRLARIRSAPKGHGPLRCPYHGWTYNEEGIPTGIPRREAFPNLKEGDASALRLARWQLGIRGKLLFVAAETAPPLENFLGDAAGAIDSLSKGFGRIIDDNQMTIAANWKIVVENTLESYHVDLIHPKSFKRLGPRGEAFAFFGHHSTWDSPVDTRVAGEWRRVEPRFATRPVKLDGYRHVLVFPNLTIATSFGASFALQSFRPVDEKTTHFRSLVLLADLGPEVAGDDPIVEAMAQSIVAFNRQVFEEDRIICEEVHRGASFATRAAMLGSVELRVAEFQNAVAKLAPEAFSVNE